MIADRLTGTSRDLANISVDVARAYAGWWICLDLLKLLLGGYASSASSL